MHATNLFADGNPRPVPLESIVFLAERRHRAAMVRTPASMAQLGKLTPFVSSFGATPVGLGAVRLARLLGAVPTYTVWPGSVSETTDLIETLLEG